MKECLYDKGVDAWWLDASEPEISTPADPFLYKEVMQNNLGTGARYLNAFSLMQTKGIYEGQRQCDPDNRVLILTRSAFAGQQSYGTVMWTGDITGTWEVFKKQLKCGLNFAASGLPYWTTDIGGFFVNSVDWPLLNQDPGYRELYTRWFQWGAFCPIMRAHGNGPRREMWLMGEESYLIQKKFVELRYQLSPYIYSLAGMAYHDDYTIMGPLLFDFRFDKNVHSIYDQYMFGPSLMVCPVLESEVQSRQVYLPEGCEWYDFWNNKIYCGGEKIEALAPLQIIPIFVKAGSILPMGEIKQYMDENRSESITLNIYAGRDGCFRLYDDDGNSYGYENGQYSIIILKWDDANSILTIDREKINYNSSLDGKRIFKIRIISNQNIIERTCVYDGNEISIKVIE